MSVTRSWKVYGLNGHRQRESFFPSMKYDWSTPEETRMLTIENADITGTNEYTILRITRDTAKDCADELDGQLSDGIFENSRTGAVVEITDEE